MIPPRLRSSEPSGLDRFFWSNNASPDIRYLRHFFPQKICESLPAHRICFVFHLMSHTPWQNLSCFTHFRSYDIFVSPFHPTANFSWLIALLPTYHLVAPVYIMASQDLISQFSPDLNAIPPSQPDRSRTPPRPQHGWHQTVPMFRGPMHFAMMTLDRFGILLVYRLHHRHLHRSQHAQHGLRPHHLSHLHRLRSPNNLSTTPILHLSDILSHRDRRDLCHLQAEALLSMRDTLVGQLKSHRLTNGNLTSTSTTPTRLMGWISPPESAKADFPVTKTLKVWILCKSHSGSSCTRAYTTHGSAVLHTVEKPSSFLLTT